MQIVIDIPDRIQYGIENNITVNGSEASQIVLDAVKSGKPYEERKTGKWINDKKSVYGGAFLERECHCSECGSRRDFIGWKFDNYCSYCGAKMEGYDD